MVPLKNNFGAIDCGENVDNMVQYLLLKLFDHLVPVKKIKIKHKPAPWINSDIKVAISKRDKAKRIYTRVPSTTIFLNTNRYELFVIAYVVLQSAVTSTNL